MVSIHTFHQHSVTCAVKLTKTLNLDFSKFFFFLDCHLFGFNHCHWYGVTCNNRDKVISFKPTHTFAKDSTLSGLLSASIANLTQLQTLSTPYNIFYGEIPGSNIGKLRSWRFLSFKAGNFSFIPNFAFWSYTQYTIWFEKCSVDLSHNHFLVGLGFVWIVWVNVKSWGFLVTFWLILFRRLRLQIAWQKGRITHKESYAFF